jgi:Subtilase family
MPRRLTDRAPGARTRRRAGSVLLVGTSAAVLVVAQAAAAVAAPATPSAAGRATTASLAMTTSLAMQPLSAAQAAQLSQHVNQHVIVFFKNQPRAAKVGTGAFRTRAGRITAFQQPLMGELSQVHATHVQSYTLVNSIAATVSAGEEARLKADPAVQEVIPDGLIYGPSTASPTAATESSALKTLPGACLPHGGVQLEPEALQVTHTDSTVPGAQTARSLGFTGAGVTVAWMADGIDPDNANFLRTPGNTSTSVFSDYKDFSGDGTTAPTDGDEAFLDANAIAGQGKVVYNIQHFSAQSPAKPCNIRIEGVAPGVNLVGLKVFGQNNASTTSGFLDAISYAVNVDHVNVLNQSFGSNPIPDLSDADAVKQFDEFAVASGVTVVVSSGDSGPFNTIGSPATDPSVISVGASTDFRFYAMTNYALADDFAKTGWLNDNISSLSSGGYSETGGTVNLVAPGDLSFASCDANLAEFAGCVNFLGKGSDIEESGGTSQSSPLTAGAAALVIQAYAKTHAGADPSPALIKQILLSTATDLGAPADEQGAGLLNTYKAVLLAESINGGTPTGNTLATSTNQLNVVGFPGQSKTWTVSVTNEGTSAQTVRLSGRGFGPSRVVGVGSVTLSNAHSKHVTNWLGLPTNYGVLHFTVPKHQNRLSAEIAYPGNPDNGLNARVRLILIDPRGRFAAHSLPQGVGNFGNVDVVNPVAGRWTAVIFGIQSGADGGTAGKVPFEASTQQYASFGAVSPSSLSLAPGATGTFTFTADTPTLPGDASGSVVLNAGHGATSIPVTLRSLVSVLHGGAFSGTLTGGNGRPGDPANGQIQYYEFNVPVNETRLSASLTIGNDREDQITGFFVNPQGQIQGYGSNYLAVNGPAGLAPTRTMSLGTVNPIPGRWTLIVDFTQPVTGNEISVPYSGHIRFYSGVSVNAGGLPDSASTTLVPGSKYTFRVKIHNTGVAPENFFLDPRLSSSETVSLLPLAPNPLTLPIPATGFPQEWLVPTESSSVTVSADDATSPVTFDAGQFLGDPDLFSGLPTGGSDDPAPVLFSGFGGTVTAGGWYAFPALATIDGYTGPAPSGATVDMDATATTREFDTTMTSSVGDFWLESVDASAPFRLYRINGGQTRAITVTIKVPASATAGTVVSGDVYVDTIVPFAQFGQVAGSETTVVPYTYTIK